MHATKKIWRPNLQKKTFINKDGKKVTMKLSTTAIRTLKKQGVIMNAGPQPGKNTKPKAKKTSAKK